MANKSLTLTASDKDFDAIVDAVADVFGYTTGDRVEFCKAVLLDKLADVRQQAARRKTRPTREQRQAERAAEKAAHAKAKTDVTVKVT
jgi:hypothetical protein